ncbi:MAG: hypothetical protein A2Z83_04625 [Omnitrophica bacterium GWA2_52_8]|nr:MAG: hypothetical protein A2Z83_04625 [Omnitrophica bacterium GWA2_52_8]
MDKGILGIFLRFTAVLAASTVLAIATYFFLAPKPGLLFPNSDFELGTLENWRNEGAAFMNQPTLGDNAAPRHKPLGKTIQGSYWIGTFENRPSGDVEAGATQGDAPQGRLTSIPFTITRAVIAFSAGAGGGTPQTSVNLLVDERAVLTESPAASPEGQEALRPVRWNTTEWLGKKARIQIKDESSGPGGHINADGFRYE